jgi:hypothetical protein
MEDMVYNLIYGIFYFQLGLTDIFTINSNLGGITTQNATLSVSDIVHKAELEVNERGGTASAATGTCLMCRTQSHWAACSCGVSKADSENIFKSEEYRFPGSDTTSLAEVNHHLGGIYWLHFQF